MCLKGRKGSLFRTFPWLDNNWHLIQLRVGHQFLGEVPLILSTTYTATFLEEEVLSHCLLLETNIFNIPKEGGGGELDWEQKNPSKARGMTGNMQM